MLPYLKNRNGFMELTLASIGLFIASSILFVVIISVVFMNDGHRVAELEGIASQFSAVFYGIDALFYEHTTQFYFPQRSYPYTVHLSTEYLVISAPGYWNTVLSVTHPLPVRSLPLNLSLNSYWNTGYDLHCNWLVSVTNHTGSITDPVDSQNMSMIQGYLHNLTCSIQGLLAKDPLLIRTDDYVSIEKVMIYYDTDGNGIWDPGKDEIQSFILLYQ